MAYSGDIANLLANQLARLATLNRHQLAGQVANLDFWLAEVRHCLAVIDGYDRRFIELNAAEQRHISEHHTVEFSWDDPCCTQERAAGPKRVPPHELKKARQGVTVSAYRFFVRCCNEGMLGEPELIKTLDDLGIELNLGDVKNARRT